MFPQPKKYGHLVVAAVLVIFAVNNPEKAADLVNQVVGAIATFANSLGG